MVNVLTLWKFLMTWHTIWCHDTPFDVMTNFFNVMVCSLLQGEFVVVMTYFMTCLYCPDIFFHHFANKILSFDVMTNFLTSWCVLYFKVNMLLWWRISWPAYSTNHVYLHRPNAFGFWQMRLHLCYETLKRVLHEPKLHISHLRLFANFDLWSVSAWWV